MLNLYILAIIVAVAETLRVLILFYRIRAGSFTGKEIGAILKLRL